MEQWVIDEAFRQYDFDTALDICFAAASCEVENMVDSKIEHYKFFNCIKDGFVPIDTSKVYRILWSKKR